MGRHEQHRFLLVAALAERNQQSVIRLPHLYPDVKATDLFRPDHYQEVVWRLWSIQHALQEHPVLSLPDARLGALKYPVDHAQVTGVHAYGAGNSTNMTFVGNNAYNNTTDYSFSSNTNSTWWTNGTGVPAGSCMTGSTYMRTEGGTGTTLYVCEASAWHAK